MILPDGTGGAFIPDDSKLNNFDISRDGKLKLTAVNAKTLQAAKYYGDKWDKPIDESGLSHRMPVQ